MTTAQSPLLRTAGRSMHASDAWRAAPQRVAPSYHPNARKARTSTHSLPVPMSNPRARGDCRVFRTTKAVPVPRNTGPSTQTGTPQTEKVPASKTMGMKYATQPARTVLTHTSISSPTSIQRPVPLTRQCQNTDHARLPTPSLSFEDSQRRSAVPRQILPPSQSMRANMGPAYARSLSPMGAGGDCARSISPGPISWRVMHPRSVHATPTVSPTRSAMWTLWPYTSGRGADNGSSAHLAPSRATVDYARTWMCAPRSLSPSPSAHPPFTYSALSGAILTPPPFQSVARIPLSTVYCAPRVLRCPSPEIVSQVRNPSLFSLRSVSPSRTACSVPHIPCPPPVVPLSSHKEPSLRTGSSTSFSAAPHSTLPVYPLTSGVPTPPSFATPSFPCSPKSVAAGSLGLIDAEHTHSLSFTPVQPETQALDVHAQPYPLPSTASLHDTSDAVSAESQRNISAASFGAPSEENVSVALSEVDIRMERISLPWQAQSGKKACPRGHGLVSQLMWDGKLPACNHCKRNLAHGEMFCSCYHCDYNACATCLREVDTVNTAGRSTWSVEDTQRFTPQFINSGEYLCAKKQHVSAEITSSRLVAQPDVSPYEVPTTPVQTSWDTAQVISPATPFHSPPQGTAHGLLTPVSGVGKVEQHNADDTGALKPQNESVSIQATNDYSRVFDECHTFLSDECHTFLSYFPGDHVEQQAELNVRNATSVLVADVAGPGVKDTPHGSARVAVPQQEVISAWKSPNGTNQKRASAHGGALRSRRSMSPSERRSSASFNRAIIDVRRSPARRLTDGPQPTPVRPMQRPSAPPRVIIPCSATPQSAPRPQGALSLPQEPDDARRPSVDPRALYVARPSASEATLQMSRVTDAMQPAAACMSMETADGEISASEETAPVERAEGSDLLGDAASAVRERPRASTLHRNTACSVARKQERLIKVKASEDVSLRKGTPSAIKLSPTTQIRSDTKTTKNGRFPSKTPQIQPKATFMSHKTTPALVQPRHVESAKAKPSSTRQRLSRTRSPPNKAIALLEARPSTPNHLRRRESRGTAVAQLHESVEVLSSQIQSLRNSISSTLENQRAQDLGDVQTTNGA